MYHHYEPCPNGCGGEVPLVLEGSDEPDVNAGQWLGIDDDENAKTHEPGCPPLTQEQRQAIEAACVGCLSDVQARIYEED